MPRSCWASCVSIYRMSWGLSVAWLPLPADSVRFCRTQQPRLVSPVSQHQACHHGMLLNIGHGVCIIGADWAIFKVFRPVGTRYTTNAPVLSSACENHKPLQRVHLISSPLVACVLVIKLYVCCTLSDPAAVHHMWLAVKCLDRKILGAPATTYDCR